MATIDLVYDPECPNLGEARANLIRAFARVGMTASWSEHRIGDPSAPGRVRGYGSPTILVGGHDVAGLSPGAEACCRIYARPNGSSGAPSVEQIAGAMSTSAEVEVLSAPTKEASSARPGGAGFRSTMAVLPGVGLALLPKVACPACWPAYAGVLTSLGLGLLMDTRWLFPLTAVFLLVAVGALAFRARRRRGFGPFFVGLAASAAILVGKFAFESDPAMYLGLGVFIVASIWNTWPRRATPVACPACVND